MSEELHIVAVAARTPLGMTAESSVAAMRAGINRVVEHPFIVDRAAEPVRTAQDSQLDPKMPLPERLTRMAASVLDEICRKVPSIPSGSRVPLLLALPEERPGWTSQCLEQVMNGVRSKPLRLMFEPIEAFSYGHAAGLLALDTAVKQIGAGQRSLIVVAGADSYLDIETLGWLDRNRQLATPYHRSAFFPGEGAGAFAVGGAATVARYGLDSLAVIRGLGTAAETCLMKTDAVCLGEGLTESIRQAMAGLKLPAEAVQGVIGDINGERYRTEEWGFALLRLADALTDPTGYELPAACWGEMGAASGPLFVAVAAMAGRRGWAKGERYLIWNSSEAGQRAAVVLQLNLQREGVRL